MLYSCNDSIQNALINNVTGLFQLSKNSLLKVIESVVTRNANPNIPHIHSENITQSLTESIQEYTVRLKSAATDCKLSSGC